MAQIMIEKPPELAQQPNKIEAMQAAATDFLFDHVGNQLVAGQPYLMASPLGTAWVVPIHLTYIHMGAIGTVGVVAVDDQTGQVFAWTPIDEIKATSRTLRNAQEPKLTQRFQSFLASPSPAVAA